MTLCRAFLHINVLHIQITWPHNYFKSTTFIERAFPNQESELSWICVLRVRKCAVVNMCVKGTFCIDFACFNYIYILIFRLHFGTVPTVWYVCYHCVICLLPLCDMFVTTVWYVCYHCVICLLPLCDMFVTTVWYVCYHCVICLLPMCDMFVPTVWYVCSFYSLHLIYTIHNYSVSQ